VRSVAWGGLTLGVTVALLPLAFAGVTWWSVALFFGLLLFFYLLSANLANSLGDAVGWRWGQSTIRRRWESCGGATPPRLQDKHSRKRG
jgi:hypothetical protein